MNKSQLNRKLPIRCELRSSGYNAEEIDALRSDLTGIADLQPRRQGIPAAGASYDICFYIQWAGMALLSGVIGNAADDLLKTSGVRLSHFYQRKQKQPSELPPGIYYLEISFDDLDLRIRGADTDNDPDGNFLSYATLIRLSGIVSVVENHLRTEPLASAGLQALEVYEPHPTLTSDDAGGLLFTRPWRVEGILQCEYSNYFPHERKLVRGLINNSRNASQNRCGQRFVWHLSRHQRCPLAVA